jgi:carbon storage regulator
MLVITRKKLESLMIGDDIEISVVDIGNGKVRIGIDAPSSMKIIRKEIIEEVKESNKSSNVDIDLDIDDLMDSLLKDKK